MRRSPLLLLALPPLALALGACGSSDSSAETASPRPTTSVRWGNYPADRTLDERGAVEAYVDALDRRDGKSFCSVVAPWIAGRFDIAGTDPEAPLSRPLACPRLVKAFIGYREDCCPPKFLGATVAKVGAFDRRGDVVGVPVTVTLRLDDDEGGHRIYEEPLEDVVWLARDEGAWRVAKLSRVASAASIALESEPAYETPPDVAAERRAFANEVAAAERRRRQRDEAYREVEPEAECARATRYPDGRRDVVDYLHPAPPTPTPQLAAADLAAMEVAAGDGQICAVFELAGPIRRETTFELAIETPGFSDQGSTGFAQGFEVHLRADRRARVSSGLDDGRSLEVPAAVGLDGSRLRLVIDAASFAAGKAFPMSREPGRLLDEFDFRGGLTLVLSRKRHLHDDLGPKPPEGVSRFRYPR